VDKEVRVLSASYFTHPLFQSSIFHDSSLCARLRFEPGENPLGVLVENLFFLFGR
jgi:hypothetical protein